MKEPGLAAGLNATFTRPVGLAQAGAWDSALRCPTRDDRRSALNGSSHNTLDDVLLADEVEDDDRDDGHN